VNDPKLAAELNATGARLAANQAALISPMLFIRWRHGTAAPQALARSTATRTSAGTSPDVDCWFAPMRP
jgi:hypothetical protein